MKKLIDRLMPYLIGLYFPLLFALQSPPELAAWRKMALWMALHVLLLVVTEILGRRVKAERSLIGAVQLWLGLFVQLFLRGLTEPAAVDLSERIRAGLLLLFVVLVFLMILSACFGGNRPSSRGTNTLRLTALMLLMPLILMIVGVFNRIFFFIGLGWGLLTLAVMLLRLFTDRNVPKPAAESFTTEEGRGAVQQKAPEEDLPAKDQPGYGFVTIMKRLSWLIFIALLIVMGIAVKRGSRTPVPASDREIARYLAYDIDIEAVKKAAGTDDAKAAVLAFCEFEKQETIGGLTWNYWKPKGIEAFLPKAEKVGEITGQEDSGLISLYYEAEDGKQVGLDIGTAEGKEIGRITVYDPKTDIAFGMIGEEYYIWRHFRGGGYPELTS